MTKGENSHGDDPICFRIKAYNDAVESNYSKATCMVIKMKQQNILMKRRDFLKGFAGLAGLTAISLLFEQRLFAQSKLAEVSAEIIPLRESATRSGLIYGAASGWEELHDAPFAASFVQECGILVPVSELKWAAVRPGPDTFNFSGPDWLMQFAISNNMLFRGHTLVWHEALPAWFQSTVNSSNAEATLRKHISTVVGHYAGKMHSWDVVNEVILPWDNQPNGLRNSPWLNLLGSGYIDLAFREAAKADPKALLVLNQDRIENDTAAGDQCRAATLALLQRLKSSGTPVHALGIESHLGLDQGTFNAQKFKTFLRDVASLGLKIMITELDVTDEKLPADISTRDSIVAGKYEEFLSVLLEEPSVIAVLTWGLSDKYTWLADQRPRADEAPVRPLPLDMNFRRKLSGDALAQAFARRAINAPAPPNNLRVL